MKCLGIESTAHTASIGAINEKGEILADVKDMYVNEKGGIIPIEAAKHHKNIFPKLLDEIKKNIDLDKIDIISFSKGPGLSPCLLEGMKFARKMALELQAPLIGVNHLTAHLEIGKLLTNIKDPVFILATGANTQVISFEGGKYRIFGECLSIGIGNALDKFGRAIGLGFPAGAKMEELAKNGKYVELPYVVKGMDVEFSGIITRAIQLHKQGVNKEDLCFSLQETCFAMLTEAAERAMAHCNKKELLLIGGVAANKRLIGMLEIMCNERNASFGVVPIKYSGDNGVMIAWQGILDSKLRKFDKKGIEKEDINPNWRIDQVKN